MLVCEPPIPEIAYRRRSWLAYQISWLVLRHDGPRWGLPVEFITVTDCAHEGTEQGTDRVSFEKWRKCVDIGGWDIRPARSVASLKSVEATQGRLARPETMGFCGCTTILRGATA